MNTKKLVIILLTAAMYLPLLAAPALTANAEAVIQARAAYGLETGDIAYCGAYPQTEITDISGLTEGPDYIVEGGKYFSVEPIEWRVLKNAEGRLLLLSAKNLDVKPYNTVHAAITWEDCTVRKWLNGLLGNPYDYSFVDRAFSAQEQNAIAEAEVENPDNPVYDANGGNATKDKLFFLSYQEAIDPSLGFPGSTDAQATRIALNTGYARQAGAADNEGAGLWWLRSPSGYGYYTTYVRYDGFVSAYGLLVYDSSVAARPAFTVDMSSVLFTSAAAGGKTAASVGGGLIGAEAPAGAVKFTLQNEAQTLDVLATVAQSRQSGAVLSFSYSGATAGANQYVSCLLQNSSDEVLYYGKLADSSAAPQGSLLIPLAGVADGAYTLRIFSEEANGDCRSDYCSAPVSLMLTVAGGIGTVSEFGGTVIGGKVYYGAYPQAEITDISGLTEGLEYIAEGGQFFSIEPVAWRVLKNAAGRLFLLSEKTLDVKPYNTVTMAITWEDCTVRKWLNGLAGNPYSYSFIERAFSAPEQAALAETDVQNPGNPFFGTNGGNATVDKIFFLSLQEAIDPSLGFPDNYNPHASRVALNSEYTRQVVPPGYWWTGAWQLRSPGSYGNDAAYVPRDGSVYYYGDYVHSINALAARPALNVDLSSVLFTSAAAGGKSAASVGGGLLGVEEQASEVKFTVRDSSLSLESVTVTGVSGRTVHFSYSGATAGTTLSAAVLDATGALKYYGKLADNIASGGSASVTVPEYFEPGYSMQIFAEVTNGDYLSDFASGFKQLDVGDIIFIPHTVSGQVKSYNPQHETALELWRAGEAQAAYSRTIPAEKSGSGQWTQAFTFPGVEPGTYTLVISKEAHTSFTVHNIVVADCDVDLTDDKRPEVQLMTMRCGDINGDGNINNSDLTILWQQANYNRSAAAADNKLCDLNGDGLINNIDLTLLWLAYNYNRGAVEIE
jgi:hypothetical protein